MFNMSKSKTEDKTLPNNKPNDFSDVENYFTDLEKRFLGTRWPFAFRWPSSHIPTSLDTRVPNVDVIDREKEILVKAELPGIDKNDIELNVTDNSLTIKAEKRQEKKEEKDNYFHQEISSTGFCRSFSLPTKVDSDNAKATFKDGVLEIVLAKREPSVTKKINVI